MSTVCLLFLLFPDWSLLVVMWMRRCGSWMMSKSCPSTTYSVPPLCGMEWRHGTCIEEGEERRIRGKKRGDIRSEGEARGDAGDSWILHVLVLGTITKFTRPVVNGNGDHTPSNHIGSSGETCDLINCLTVRRTHTYCSVRSIQCKRPTTCIRLRI